MKPGRKPADRSRAAEICARLATWRQQPAEQRPSLRALAAELGTSHQMLSFHLKGLNDWQRREYFRKSQEIRAKGFGMTWAGDRARKSSSLYAGGLRSG